MNNVLSKEKVDLNKLRRDITVICNYLHYDEQKHYEESGRPQNHIWRYINRIERWLKEQWGIGGVPQNNR